LPDRRRGRNRQYTMADIALDGTEFFRSRHIHCPNCSTRKRSDGATEHFHSMLAAKPGGHTTLYEYLHGIDLPARRAASGKGARRLIHRYRWMSDLPIRATGDALRVNWLDIEIARPNSTVTYRGSFIASLPVNRNNVAELAECARARWKIENETFNVLKQHGYHLEHNFGHGKKTLAGVLVVLNLIAFALHNACELAESLWQRARLRLGARQRLFEHLRSITAYHVFPTWTDLMTLLATGHAPPQPP